ncbi:alpha-D-glucose phosphate-specific phosphoglucomutase [Thioalkalivibrio sp. XN279]|uniref:alpha-D-glucose phosphate-specific phosphoglucomutase n=1 Tax=Thioalkalivibrio sp. XN279 TaxID=2714953 RepID=UPI00140B617C|nr:alpha-D-glucose phosphate-specific phosphoglucomutase [Thioalkalivibrio sp. XN279]NHA13580.1 alpha-D-glucose phosphate-specific phosphoglucomutase [Thioalkalivibrio sp. XN279]
MDVRRIPTEPFDDQRPGTAGLRKKVSRFREPNYLENFLQSVFDAAGDFRGATLVAGGDGRYWNAEALERLFSIAAGNGVRRIVVGRQGMLSTPAASHLIRLRGAAGGFLLTASHNPGGPDGDFGVKFDTANGGQAPEALTEAVWRRSLEIREYRVADVAAVDLDELGVQQAGPLEVEVVDPVADYAALMEQLFDFERIRALLGNGRFRMRFDALNAVTGPYAVEILERRLGAPAGTVVNAVPLPDFGGLHPDPNPVDAAHLVAWMSGPGAGDLAAASDGDGDRNMIVGRDMMVSPGDSLALLAEHAREVPGYAAGLAGIARSMPTSRAVDRVAEALGVPCFETPTGWRFFCNLLDAGRVDLCGEESFGTSSSHAREKDGLWAVLFWLNLVAVTGRPVAGLVQDHWRRFGRHAFARHDWFIADGAVAAGIMAGLEGRLAELTGQALAGARVTRADSFTYTDPIDGSVSAGQGLRVFLDDGSRLVYRLSGTGTQGATLRIYLERYLAPTADHGGSGPELTAALGSAAARLARIPALTGIEAPAGII